MSADDVLTDMHDDLLQTDLFGVHTLTYTAPDGTATPVARAWFREAQQQVEPVRESDGEALERRATAHWPSATVVPELRGTVTYDGDIWTILTRAVRDEQPGGRDGEHGRVRTDNPERQAGVVDPARGMT